MYTVLIQSKKTMERFQHFYPLLAQTVESGQAGVCQWIESGDTLDTVLPELYDLVHDKKDWKAMVVSTEFPTENTDHPATPMNPFDFLENKDRAGFDMAGGQIVDSPIPLVRLSHLLGGIPGPEPEFEPVVIPGTEGKASHVEYRQTGMEEMEERRLALRRWSERHAFPGTPPSEILLVHVRRGPAAQDPNVAVSASWKVRSEVDSSGFWKRNLYPCNTRFLVFDLEPYGAMQKQRDLFRLWTAVLLLAINPLAPDVLQAHKLYRLDLLLDQKALECSFQALVNKLNRARFRLETDLETPPPEDDGDRGLPDYKAGVPVSFHLPEESSTRLEARAYGLTAGDGRQDLICWEAYREDAEKKHLAMLRNVNRTLDQASARLRELCRFQEEQVRQLSQIQQDEMEQALSQVYLNILEEQENLPGCMVSARRQVEDADRRVRGAIVSRLSRSQALTVAAGAAGLMTACLIPGLAQAQSAGNTALAVLAAGGTLLLAWGLVLALQRRALWGLMRDYQTANMAEGRELERNASAYSRFLSSIATHIRGRSYLNIMRSRQRQSSAVFFRRKHIKQIDILLEKLTNWCTALHVKVDLRSVEAVKLLDEDFDDIDYDKLYQFDPGERHPVPINQSGLYAASPYSFVERLLIQREEVYEDAHG